MRKVVSCTLLLASMSLPLSAASAEAPPKSEPKVVLSDTQLALIKVDTSREHAFAREKHAVGNIDFNQDMLTQVFTPYQGRIIRAFAKVGDAVSKDDILFTIDSPDLVQAESTLIAAAGVLQLTTKTLNRQKTLAGQSAAAQKDYEQSISDQQAAEGAYKAASAAVRVFGKTDAEIEKIVSERKIDPALVVRSPISGLITARTASPGLLVQPGGTMPVFVVADTSTMWMEAYVPEKDAPDLKVGQEVSASVSSLPERAFLGKTVAVGASIDPNTRRVLVRAEINDPNHELRAGMFATFVVTVGPPRISVAVPQECVVREGDGSMTVWIEGADKHVFTKRIVRVGVMRDGFTEILDGLKVGERVAADGSLFIANQYANAGR